MNKKRLTIILLVCLFLIIIFIISAFIINLTSKAKLYKCYYYQENYNDQNINIINKYQYFNLELKKDKTFTLKYAVKGSSDKTKIGGVFSDKNNIITLIFVERPIEFILFESLEFVRVGNELYCHQSVTIDDSTITITLKFKKAIF